MVSVCSSSEYRGYKMSVFGLFQSSVNSGEEGSSHESSPELNRSLSSPFCLLVTCPPSFGRWFRSRCSSRPLVVFSLVCPAWPDFPSAVWSWVRGEELFGSTFVLLHSLPKKTDKSAWISLMRKYPGHIHLIKSSNERK